MEPGSAAPMPSPNAGAMSVDQHLEHGQPDAGGAAGSWAFFGLGIGLVVSAAIDGVIW